MILAYTLRMRLLTLSQAAELLGLSPGTLRVQVERGALRARKLGTFWTVTPAEVERYRQDHLGQRKGGPKAKRRPR